MLGTHENCTLITYRPYQNNVLQTAALVHLRIRRFVRGSRLSPAPDQKSLTSLQSALRRTVEPTCFLTHL